jgi:hypothetical protein
MISIFDEPFQRKMFNESPLKELICPKVTFLEIIVLIIV